MAGKYQAYPAYKDSGVEWFGDIPVAWKVAGFKKYLESIIDYRGKTPNKCTHGILLVTARNIKRGILDYSLSQEYVAEKDYDSIMSRGKPELGDLLFTTEAPLGEVANIDDTNIALAQRVIKFSGKTKILNNFFLKYLIMSSAFQQSLYMFASGSTVKGIKAERFVYLRTIFPSTEDQTQIANFLDHETAKIDTLIEKQQQLIKLLKEKRQAVISHAVTKGLNPDAPMKPSGVEWIGNVPEHWVILSVRRVITRVEQGWSPEAANFAPDENDWGVAKLSSVKKGAFIANESKTLLKGTNPDESIVIKEGDLLITRANTPNFVGDSCVVHNLSHKRIMLCDLIYRLLVVRRRAAAEFVMYFFLSDFGRTQIRMDARGSSMTMAKISQQHIRSWFLALPPLNEQEKITAHLVKKTKSFDHIITRSETMIHFLQERRTALISAAVTGKIDVRNWQPPEPNETQENTAS